MHFEIIDRLVEFIEGQRGPGKITIRVGNLLVDEGLDLVEATERLECAPGDALRDMLCSDPGKLVELM